MGPLRATTILLMTAVQGFALTPEEAEFFEKKVRPVLAERCYECHSATARKVKGNLLLDSRAGVLKGGDSGPALVPGKPEKSLVIKAVRYDDEDLQMPPKHRLDPQEVANLEQWVKMGAPDPREATADAAAFLGKKTEIDFEAARKFWSFQAIRFGVRWLDTALDSEPASTTERASRSETESGVKPHRTPNQAFPQASISFSLPGGTKRD